MIESPPISESDLFFVTKKEESIRLDKLLSSRFRKRSRSYFQYLIENGCVLINEKKVKKRVIPKYGDEIAVFFRLTPEISIEPEDIPLDILYEDNHIIAINKPPGMVVHPAAGHWSSTFVNALLFHCRHLKEKNSLRPGIVHRLDKDTSGILLAAKTLEAQSHLISFFSQKKISKYYLAICINTPPDNYTLTAPIGRHRIRRKEMSVTQRGKKAISHFSVLAKNEQLSFILAQPFTGRTHQLRVHLKHIKTPILGDSIYGNKKFNEKYSVHRQMLHAYRLSFPHPITGKKIDLSAPLLEDMKKNLSFFTKLEKNCMHFLD